MKEAFDKINSVCFNNELVPISLKIKKLSRNTLGGFSLNPNKEYKIQILKKTKSLIYSFKVKGAQFSNFFSREFIEKECNPSIFLNVQYAMSEKDWFETMVHEVAHYKNFAYDFKSDLENERHGSLFNKTCEEMASKLGLDAHSVITSEDAIIDGSEDYIQSQIKNSSIEKPKGYIIICEKIYDNYGAIKMLFLAKSYGVIEDLREQASSDTSIQKVSYIVNNHLFVELSLDYKVANKGITKKGKTYSFNCCKWSSNKESTLFIDKIINENQDNLKVVFDSQQGINIKNENFQRKEKKKPQLCVLILESRGTVGKIYNRLDLTSILVTTRTQAQNMLRDYNTLDTCFSAIFLSEDQDLAYWMVDHGYSKSQNIFKNYSIKDESLMRMVSFASSTFSTVWGEYTFNDLYHF